LGDEDRVGVEEDGRDEEEEGLEEEDEEEVRASTGVEVRA
jgi:hypothetical protein